MQFLIQAMDMERHLGLVSLDPFKVHLLVFVEVLGSLTALPSSAALSVLDSSRCVHFLDFPQTPFIQSICMCVKLTKDLTK